MRSPRVDYANKRFGKLLVTKWIGNGRWECQCECGVILKVITSNLTTGHTTSCGHHSIKSITHGMTNTKEYSIWLNMKNRCHNSNGQDYHNYGGRGITVCEEWMKFENFYCDMGDCPQGYSLERRDNEKGYNKENCKWATRREQALNRRSNKIFTYKGITKPLKELCAYFDVDYKLVHARLSKGYVLEDAIELPKQVNQFI